MAGGIWLSRQIVLPLARAVELADKVAHGQLNNHIDIRGKDEIAALKDKMARVDWRATPPFYYICSAEPVVAFPGSLRESVPDPRVMSCAQGARSF